MRCAELITDRSSIVSHGFSRSQCLFVSIYLARTIDGHQNCVRNFHQLFHQSADKTELEEKVQQQRQNGNRCEESQMSAVMQIHLQIHHTPWNPAYNLATEENEKVTGCSLENGKMLV